MAAWYEPPRKPRTFYAPVAFLIYVAALAGLVGLILWKLWTGYKLGSLVP
jgi:hypothetical protein